MSTELRDTVRVVMHGIETDAMGLSRKLGVTPNTVWRYLAGSIYPSPDVLGRLALIGELDYKELLAQKAMEQARNRAEVRANAEPHYLT